VTAVESVLTDGQVAVLRLVADGRTLRQAATELGVSESTVSRRAADAATLLGTNHISHTVAVAIRRGLLKEEPPVSDRPRIFHLQRDEDVTGASGTGHVADGVLWPDGTVTVKWLGEYASEVSWPKGMAAVERIHGHDGRTRIVWDDEEPGRG
jgi:DNA-binding CsgD family transcriptional regulator